MQKKSLFLSKNLHNSKKSSNFAPAFEKKHKRSGIDHSDIEAERGKGLPSSVGRAADS